MINYLQYHFIEKINLLFNTVLIKIKLNGKWIVLLKSRKSWNLIIWRWNFSSWDFKKRIFEIRRLITINVKLIRFRWRISKTKTTLIWSFKRTIKNIIAFNYIIVFISKFFIRVTISKFCYILSIAILTWVKGKCILKFLSRNELNRSIIINTSIKKFKKSVICNMIKILRILIINLI